MVNSEDELLRDAEVKMMKTIDDVIQKLEYIMESDPRTFSNPECEYGWVFHRINEAIKMLKEIEKEFPSTEQQWHDCDPTDKSTLPKPGSWAIWSDKEGHRIIARWKEDAIDHFFPDQRMFDFNLEDAVAWMEIPKRTEKREQE